MVLNIDRLPPTHGWLRVRKEQKDDAEFAKIREMFPLADGKGRTALYVGASRWRNFYLDDILLAGYTTDIVEVDRENCRVVSGWYAGDVRSVYCSDIRDWTIHGYDLVAFVHVLEHMPQASAERVIEDAKVDAKTIVVCCPVEQKVLDGAAYGNVHESHEWSVPRGWLTSLGFREEATGPDRVVGLWYAGYVPSVDP
jgi:hypothetical protein